MGRFKVALVDGAIETLVTPCTNSLIEQFPQYQFTYHAVGFSGPESLYRLTSLDGLILLGSASNVDEDQHSWHGPLADFAKMCLLQDLPTLGICFGHQLVAAMFGGKVGYHFSNREKIVGHRTSKVVGGHLPGLPEELNLLVSHRQTVQSLPEGMYPWLVAQDFPFDGLAHESLPYWGVQHHPEVSLHAIERSIYPFQEEEIHRVQADGRALLQSFLRKVSRS